MQNEKSDLEVFLLSEDEARIVRAMRDGYIVHVYGTPEMYNNSHFQLLIDLREITEHFTKYFDQINK